MPTKILTEDGREATVAPTPQRVAEAVRREVDVRGRTPIVAERIPLVEARRAYENLARGGGTGKQLLICDEEAAKGSI